MSTCRRISRFAWAATNHNGSTETRGAFSDGLVVDPAAGLGRSPGRLFADVSIGGGGAYGSRPRGGGADVRLQNLRLGPLARAVARAHARAPGAARGVDDRGDRLLLDLR